MSRGAVAGLVALGAVALAASYPPFTLPWVSFFALTPAVVLLRRLAESEEGGRRAFRWGFWYGAAGQGLVLYWLVVALWHFTALAALGYLITVTILALFTGGLFWAVTEARRRLPRLGLAVALPLAWTAMEWIIGHLSDVGFPWLGLGTSLADAPVVVQWADIAGSRGITWWVVWCNVLLGDALLALPAWRTALRRAAPVAASLLLALGYGVWREQTLPLRDVGVVGLVQPNEGFQEKWVKARADTILARAIALSRRVQAEAHPDLVIWPESAIPGYLVQEPDWDRTLAAFTRETGTPLLAGTLHVEFGAGGGYQTYNAAVYFDSTGRWRSWPVYKKHYLVPVVERVPFVPVAWFRRVPWLEKWSGGFGRGTSLPLYRSRLGRFGVLICYESIFEDLARDYRREGADFLVNITNDGWYGRTAGPYQHASHLVMRAIETRMGIARAANTGISETVDPLGYAHDQTSLELETAVASRLRTSDVVTLYVRLGDWVGLFSVVGTIVIAGLVLAVRYRGGD